MSKVAEVSWADVVAAETGHIFIDKFDEGLRFIVMRGPAALCAYVGLPKDHPLAGHNYDDLPVQAHGGLTFGREAGKQWPEGYYWYGWDYGHAGDFSVYDEKYRDAPSDDKKWTPAEVEADSWNAIYDFKHLMKLAENIAAKAGK